MSQQNSQKSRTCQHCEGQGYIDIRDCTEEIQRQETCLFCNGTGELQTNN